MKLQARVDHILPTATARTDYVTGLEKWPANGQFFDGAQMAVSLEQTTQIISGVSFITAHVAYATKKIKPKLFESRGTLLSLFKPGADAPHGYVRDWALCCFHSLVSIVSIQTFRRALTASVDSCAEIKSAPSVA